MKVGSRRRDEGLSGGTKSDMATEKQQRERKRVDGCSPTLEKKGRRDGM